MTEDGPRRDTAPQRADLTVEIMRHGTAWADSKIGDGMVARAAQAALAEASPETATCSLTIVLTDDAEMAALNRTWRGKDAPTNVLSFPSGDAPGDPGALGDIVIAHETTRREADDDNISLGDHVCHLVVHGVLHLLGLDHLQDAEAERMEALETRALASIGIADPYEGDGAPGEGESKPGLAEATP